MTPDLLRLLADGLSAITKLSHDSRHDDSARLLDAIQRCTEAIESAVSGMITVYSAQAEIDKALTEIEP